MRNFCKKYKQKKNNENVITFRQIALMTSRRLTKTVGQWKKRLDRSHIRKTIR